MNLHTLRAALAAEAGRFPTPRAALLWAVVRALDVVIRYDNARCIQEHIERVNYRREGNRA